MTSKIDSLGAAAIGAASAAKPAGDKSAAAVSSAVPAPPVDKVSLTGEAVRMQQLDKAAASAPVIDSKRVAATKSAVSSGSYRVDSKTVASKLSRMEWELGAQ